jgi:two-component system NarL family sensor kinase
MPNGSESSPDAWVEKVLRSAVEAVEARCGAVALVDGGNHSLSRVASWGPFPTFKGGMAVARWVATQGKALALQTRQQASRVPGLVIDRGEELPLVCVPIESRDGVLGALQANVPPFGRNEDVSHKLRTLELAADLVGCILENARLEQELQEKEGDVTRLVKASIDAQETERERICLEVHDGVAQTLVSAFQYLQALENTPLYQMPEAKQRITRATGLVRQAIQEARDVINSLTPATLRDLGLVATLRQELRQFQKETGCKVEFEASWPRLAKDTEVALYRILHEAATNVRKHANSRRMRIELSLEADRLVAQVKDWGCGFEFKKHDLSATGHSTGLFSMRKRAELLGGTCDIRSALGKGTEVRIEVPIVE